MALTKVEEQTLLAITETASNSATVGAAVDVSTYYAIDVRIRMGRGTGTAFTVGPIARIEGSYDSTSPTAGQWVVLASFQAALGTNVGSQLVSGSEAAGQTVITLAAGTNFAAGDYIFIHDNTLSSSEWCRVLSVATADLTLEEATLSAHDGSDTVRDQAEQYHALIDVTSIQQVRLVINGAGSGQAVVHAAEFGAVSGL